MRINVEYSTQHWIFPIITIGILVILGVLLIALEGRARIKAGKGFFVKPSASSWNTTTSSNSGVRSP